MAVPYQAFLFEGKQAPKTITMAEEMEGHDKAGQFVVEVAKLFEQGKIEVYHLNGEKYLSSTWVDVDVNVVRRRRATSSSRPYVLTKSCA